MRKIFLATTFAVITTTVMAQQSMPRMTVIKDPDGHTISTATSWRGITVFRNAGGDLLGSAETTADGVITYYDPSGKVTETSTTNNGVTTIRNSAGEVTGTRTREGEAMIIRDREGRIIGKTERE